MRLKWRPFRTLQDGPKCPKVLKCRRSFTRCSRRSPPSSFSNLTRTLPLILSGGLYKIGQFFLIFWNYPAFWISFFFTKKYPAFWMYPQRSHLFYHNTHVFPIIMIECLVRYAKHQKNFGKFRSLVPFPAENFRKFLRNSNVRASGTVIYFKVVIL